jgi:hypothetical protein
MGYMHIDNLYKVPQILEFKKVWALEKIHGTSAHIKWHGNQLTFFSGGESYDRFKNLFDKEKLEAKFIEKFGTETLEPVIIYGEAYGGRQQGMSHTYGPDLKFIAFDVNVYEQFLDVEQAAGFVGEFGLEFVDYQLVDTDLDSLNGHRDAPSIQAVRNGITEPKLREGIVIRPPFECKTNRGRLIVKYKGDAFSEREKPVHELGPERAVKMEEAEKVSLEWVTPMRLEHVIDRLIRERKNKEVGMEDSRALINLMVEDVGREGEGEVEMTQAVKKSIGQQTVRLLKQRLIRELA